MKIFTQGWNPDKIGGGHSFLSYFRKGDWELVDDPDDCDIYFITSVSMLDKLSQIPLDKKIVMRVDNVLKNSCNREVYGFGSDKVTRMEAMRQIAQKAHLIVYQSQWARGYLSPFLGHCGAKQRVIINGSDDELFNKSGGMFPCDYKPIYLYVRSSNHDNKGWHVAWYEYQTIYRQNPNAILWIVGRFSPENTNNNFDFFNDENWRYWGYIQDRETIAMIMRSADYLLYSFWNDACSQTLLESYLSGLKIKWLAGSESGGSLEIRNLIHKQGREALSYKRMNAEYLKEFNEFI